MAKRDIMLLAVNHKNSVLLYIIIRFYILYMLCNNLAILPFLDHFRLLFKCVEWYGLI